MKNYIVNLKNEDINKNMHIQSQDEVTATAWGKLQLKYWNMGGIVKVSQAQAPKINPNIHQRKKKSNGTNPKTRKMA